MNLLYLLLTVPVLAACGLLWACVRLRRRLRDREADTDRNTEVIRELRLRLARTRRMEAVGIYAGSIVHNLSNLVSVIQGNLRLAESVPEGTGEGLRKAAAAGRVAGELLTDLGRFYHQAHEERKPTDLEPLVRDTVKLVADLLPPDVEIQADLLPCGPVLASPSGIQQVLMNLCNPPTAREGRGRIHVSLREEIVAGGRKARPRPLPSGSYVRLTVRDSRPGLDHAALERILDTYYDDGPGFEQPGLGLASVSRFIEHAGAAATSESDGAQGTAFSIYFPLIAWSVVEKEPDLEMPDAEMDPPDDLAQAPPVRILLVEDEELVADVLARGLRVLGHAVTVAVDGRRALEAFRGSPRGFDVVITDQIMPHMSGVRLARQLRAEREGLPMILVSGFHDSYQEAQAREAGIREFVTKPCSHLDLARAIGRLGLGRMEGRA